MQISATTGKHLWESPRQFAGNLPTTGKGIGVVVMDQGFDVTHPDFKDQIATTVATGPDDEFEFDKVGHGSHAMGIIGANGSSSAGQIQGVAPGARLIPIVVNLKPDAGWEAASGSFASAIQWAVENKEEYNIRVINCSFVMPLVENVDETGAVRSVVDPLSFAIDLAVKNGITIVAGVGNFGEEARIKTPAGNPKVLAVGALDCNGTPEDSSDDKVADFSSRGRSIFGEIKPDVVALGVKVMSVNAAGSEFETHNRENALKARTALKGSSDEMRALAREQVEAGMLDPLAMHLEEGDLRKHLLRCFRIRPTEGQNGEHPAYIAQDGSSMASPFVAGVIANMLEANPDLTPADNMDIIRTTAQPVAGAPPEAQGQGAVQAAAAVAEAIRRRG